MSNQDNPQQQQQQQQDATPFLQTTAGKVVKGLALFATGVVAGAFVGKKMGKSKSGKTQQVPMQPRQEQSQPF